MLKITHFMAAVLLVSIMAGCGKNTKIVEEKHQEAAGHGEHEGENDGPAAITVSEESKKVMGLELTTVAYRDMEETLAVTGEIAKDTEKVYHITPKMGGTVVRLNVTYYDIVKQGDILGTIKTDQSAIDVISPYNGMVTVINVTSGQQVDEITSLMTISDLSAIHASFDVYEKDAGKVKVGQKIKVKSMAYPDKTFIGKIIFISPRVDEQTRTIKARAEIDNSGYMLKFNMFVTGKIITNAGLFLSVPVNAVQKVDDKVIVFVSHGDKEFVAAEIRPGFEENNQVQILSGVKEGDAVAVEGSFLLKSELLKAEMGDGCAE